MFSFFTSDKYRSIKTLTQLFEVNFCLIASKRFRVHVPESCPSSFYIFTKSLPSIVFKIRAETSFVWRVICWNKHCWWAIKDDFKTGSVAWHGESQSKYMCSFQITWQFFEMIIWIDPNRNASIFNGTLRCNIQVVFYSEYFWGKGC